MVALRGGSHIGRRVPVVGGWALAGAADPLGASSVADDIDVA